jgi:hypothetical protein
MNIRRAGDNKAFRLVVAGLPGAGLIREAEYKKKRAEIMVRKW